MNNILLGVNIDHIATLRQARGTNYPDPVQAAFIAEQSGADSITVHLREDRRHIQDRDIELLSQTIQTRMNLEMAVTEEMISIAEKIRPADVCLVPEKREELTTEGGLDIVTGKSKIKQACERLADAGIRVSLFIDPEQNQLDASLEVGAPVVELHTGAYADTHGIQQENELHRLIKASQYGSQLGLEINAGHGLHYHNTKQIVAIPEINELNIGHSIIAQAVMIGLGPAVMKMKNILNGQ